MKDAHFLLTCPFLRSELTKDLSSFPFFFRRQEREGELAGEASLRATSGPPIWELRLPFFDFKMFFFPLEAFPVFIT